MNLPAPVVRNAFRRAQPERLDFDAIAAPRRLPASVGATAAEAASDLAWFWNSNESWAPEQVALADEYEELAARLVESAEFAPGDRVILPAREPRRRREAFLRALPAFVEAMDWPVGADLRSLLDARTRMVVMSKSCGVTGELAEVTPLSRLLSGAGVLLVVEASHFVAHGSLDVRRFRCDALLFAADELFGAEGAAMWTKRPPSGSAPQSDRAASSLAGVVRYVEELGAGATAVTAPPSDRFGRRKAMRRGMQGIRQEERVLCRQLLSGLGWLKGIRVLGEGNAWRSAQRTPAVTFVTGGDDRALAENLRERGIAVGFGDFGTPEVLRAYDASAAIRVSLAHYHTSADIDRFLSALREAL